MNKSRESYTISFRLQSRDPHQKALYQWLKSHERSEQKDFILTAVKLFARCYVARFQGVSEQQLLEIYHLNRTQLNEYFYQVFIDVFGYEKVGILADYDFPEKGKPNLGQNSPPKSSINSEAQLDNEDDDDDDLYGGEIDEDLGDDVSI